MNKTKTKIKIKTKIKTKTYQHVEIAKGVFPSHFGAALFAKVGSQIRFFLPD